MNPDWEYMFWTDEDNERLVRDDYPTFWDTFQKVKKGVVKSDLCRLLYLHKHGGMYADMDFVCLKDMEPLLSPLGDHIVLGKHNNSRQPLPNAWMYSPKGDTFWLAMALDSFNEVERGVRTSIEQIAGPDRLKWAVDVHKPNHTTLSYGLIYPRAWGDVECDQVARTVSWDCVDDLKKIYHKSYAVTLWTHNW
tara:strand:+ start:132 stop:710 length:579 start_codon:yes stop_codon:yes gene_type:complete